MSSTEPVTADSIKKQVASRVKDFDPDEWDSYMDQKREQFGEYGDEVFVARAVAHVEYDVKVDGPGSLPGGGASQPQGSLQDGIEHYNISDLNRVDYENSEQIEITGFISDRWTDTSNSGNPQVKCRIIDETGETTVMATGETNVEALDGPGIDAGDLVTIRGAEVFHPEDSDYYGVTVPYWSEVTFPQGEDALSLDDISKDYQEDIVNLGDLVRVRGLVSDMRVNEYTGCANCMKKWNPEDSESTRLCPNCGHDEAKTYRPGSLSIKGGQESVTVSFPPSKETPDEGVMYSEVEVVGVLEEEEYNDQKYRQVEVTFIETLEEGIDLSPPEPDPVPETEPVDEPETTEKTTETDVDLSSHAKAIQEKAIDFSHEMPMSAGQRIIETDSSLDTVMDPEEQVEIMRELVDAPGIEIVEKGDSELEDPDTWQNVMIKPE